MSEKLIKSNARMGREIKFLLGGWGGGIGVEYLKKCCPLGIFNGISIIINLVFTHNSQMMLCVLKLVKLKKRLFVGVLPVSVDQQEALCRLVLHTARDSRQDRLQGHRDSQTGQQPPGGKPHHHLSTENSH